MLSKEPNLDFTEQDLNALEAKNSAFWSKLDDESDLGMVLSAGAYFEDKLASCIRHYLLRGDVGESLLQPRGALGTFGAKLDCAYCLRIIDDQQLLSLRKLAKIRNRFAHNLLISFNDSSIGDMVSDFFKSYVDPATRDQMSNSPEENGTRKTFEFTVFLLGMDLSHREIDVWMHTKLYENLLPSHLDEAMKKFEASDD